MLNDVQLRVVPIESVRPHEIADGGREARIERRIREDGVLRDPLLVGAVPDVEGYVLLDGTNRLRALQAIGASGAMVQVIDYADTSAVQLRTWCHAAGVSIGQIVDRVSRVDSLEVVPLLPLASEDALADPLTLALLLCGSRQCVIRRRADAFEPRHRQLRALVDIYEDRMTRVDCDPEGLEERGHALAAAGGEALVAFPRVTRGQVVAMAMNDTPIPAGITRHVILRGRALRVNIPLDVLLHKGVEESNGALQRHLAGLQPRMYREPTILFDS